MDLVRHRRYGFGLFIVVFLFSGNGFAEDAPGATARLTLREAIEIALKHHPGLLAARGTSQVQKAMGRRE